MASGDLRPGSVDLLRGGCLNGVHLASAQATLIETPTVCCVISFGTACVPITSRDVDPWTIADYLGHCGSPDLGSIADGAIVIVTGAVKITSASSNSALHLVEYVFCNKYNNWGIEEEEVIIRRWAMKN